MKDKFNFHSISDTVFLHGPTEQIRDVTNILGFEFRHSGFDEGTGLVERDAILVFSDVSKALCFFGTARNTNPTPRYYFPADVTLHFSILQNLVLQLIVQSLQTVCFDL